MASKIKCPFCSEEYPLQSDMTGKKVECTNCGRKFLIGPTAPGAVAPVPPPPPTPAPAPAPAPQGEPDVPAADSTVCCPKCAKQYDARQYRPGEVVSCACGSPFRIPGPRKKLQRTTGPVSAAQRDALRSQCGKDLEPPSRAEKLARSLFHPYGFLFYAMFMVLVVLTLMNFPKDSSVWKAARGLGIVDLVLLTGCLTRGIWLLMQLLMRLIQLVVKPELADVERATAISFSVLTHPYRQNPLYGMVLFLADLLMLPFPFVFHWRWMPNILQPSWARWRYLQDAIAIGLAWAYLLGVALLYGSGIAAFFVLQARGLAPLRLGLAVAGVAVIVGLVISLKLLLLKTLVAYIDLRVGSGPTGDGAASPGPSAASSRPQPPGPGPAARR